MTSPSDTAQRIRTALEPFVRPREEASHIRHVLKAHLAASLKTDEDALDGSLALIDLAWDTAALPEARGLQRKYLQALQANIEARRAFEEQAAQVAAAPVATREASETTTAAGAPSLSLLQDHLAAVRLGRKRDRLQVVNRYLDELEQKPVAAAAGEDYLLPEFIYGDATRTLPPVPKAVVNGLAEVESEKAGATDRDGPDGANAAAAADLDGLVARLEKLVLRAQLDLRQEEKRLAAAKTRAAQHDAMAPATAAAKLRALGAARNGLISWIETELGNAASDETANDGEGEADADSSRVLRQSLLNRHGVDAADGRQGLRAKLEDRLVTIRAKYASYVDARRELVHAVAAMSSGATAAVAVPNPLFAAVPQLSPQTDKAEPTLRNAAISASAVAKEMPATASENSTVGPAKAVALGHLLLAPYLEQLLAVAHDQKADITHKAHYNVLLTRRLKDVFQMLDHLADESQLLPQYGPQGSRGAAGGATALLRKKGGVLAGGIGGSDGGPEAVSQRVAAWTDAAESAKIATFEAVYEQVEEGQVALERATEALAEVDKLLGQETKAPGDIWATLDGELGLLTKDERP